ncbi:MAG TPA: O-antigen ligase family protein [Chitinophagaceae bacterium]|nr:O-antigen ligase family protein [Chitinophagaceae bacterium]
MLLVLPLVAVLMAWLIVKMGDTMGFALIVVIIGAALALCAVLYPLFGLYLALFTSFFIYDIPRLLQLSLPLSSLVDFLVLATFLGVLIKKVKDRERFWKHCSHPIVYAYLIYSSYALLQLFNPNLVNTSTVILILRKYFVMLLYLYCAIQLFGSVREIERFVKIFIGAALITALYGIGQKWFGLPDYTLNYILSDPLRTSLYALDTGGFRIFSFLSDPRDYGLLMSACALLPMVLLMNTEKRKTKILLGVCAVLFLLAMTYSGTRTANFMLVMGVMLYILMTLTHKATLVFAGVTLFAFIFILYGPIYGNPTINRIRSTFDVDREESLQVRDINRKRIQPYIYEHPIGGGLGTTGVLNSEDNQSHPLSGFPSDSGLLQTALETGYIGLFLQLSLYFIILQQGIHAYYRNRRREIRRIILAGCVILFSYMCAQFAQVAIGLAPGIFVYYGLIAAFIRLRPGGKIEGEPAPAEASAA